jgi:hypothetical protein
VSAVREVLVFGFGGARPHFEGAIVGALERAESGGPIRIAEALVAVVVEHRWLEALAGAAERAGGSLLAQEPWPRTEEDLVARAVVAARALADGGQRA